MAFTHINHPPNLLTYFEKFCETATGGRVVVAIDVVTPGLTFYCTFCGTRHTEKKSDLSASISGSTMTWVTSQWLQEHRHVCDLYSKMPGLGDKCATCGWYPSAHKGYSASIDQAKFEKYETYETKEMSFTVPKGYKLVKIEETKPVQEFEGRRFR